MKEETDSQDIYSSIKRIKCPKHSYTIIHREGQPCPECLRLDAIAHLESTKDKEKNAGPKAEAGEFPKSCGEITR